MSDQTHDQEQDENDAFYREHGLPEVTEVEPLARLGELLDEMDFCGTPPLLTQEARALLADVRREVARLRGLVAGRQGDSDGPCVPNPDGVDAPPPPDLQAIEARLQLRPANMDLMTWHGLIMADLAACITALREAREALRPFAECAARPGLDCGEAWHRAAKVLASVHDVRFSEGKFRTI